MGNGRQREGPRKAVVAVAVLMVTLLAVTGVVFLVLPLVHGWLYPESASLQGYVVFKDGSIKTLSLWAGGATDVDYIHIDGYTTTEYGKPAIRWEVTGSIGVSVYFPDRQDSSEYICDLTKNMNQVSASDYPESGERKQIASHDWQAEDLETCIEQHPNLQGRDFEDIDFKFWFGEEFTTKIIFADGTDDTKSPDWSLGRPVLWMGAMWTREGSGAGITIVTVELEGATVPL